MIEHKVCFSSMRLLANHRQSLANNCILHHNKTEVHLFQSLVEMEYREYTLSIPAKLFAYVDDSTCRCLPGTVECVCSSGISACHIMSAGFLLTINPNQEFPVFIDSGKSPCYWNLPRRGAALPWSSLSGVTYGHSNIPLTLSQILNYTGDSEFLPFYFFL